MSTYDSIIRGLDQAIEHANGTRAARKTRVTIQPLAEFTPEEVKGIRLDTGLGQALFAMALGVSTKTVEAWESGRNTPNGPSRRLLQLIKEKPEAIEEFVAFSPYPVTATC